MANILKSLLFCAIIALAFVYFSKDSTPEGGDAEVSLIPLEGVIVQPPAPALVAEPEPEPEPIAVVIDVDLDKWNRMLVAQRKSALVQAEYAPLADFFEIFEGNSRKVRGAVVASSAAVNAGFNAYASSWGRGGIDAIAATFASSTSNSAADLAWAEAVAVMAIQEDDFAVAGTALGVVLDGMMSAGYDRARVLELKPMINLVSQKLSKFLPFEAYQVPAGSSYWQICRDFNSMTLEGMRSATSFIIKTG